MPRSLAYLDLADRFRKGETSPSRELAARLKRLDEVEPTLKAFVHVARDAALAAAKASDERWQRGAPLSAIDGMPIGIKDIIETADMPTGQGSPSWEGTRTHRDAASVFALRQAGAIILGKTTTTEFAAAATFAPTTNPHDPERTPGGSSSGSAAAVGAGVLPAGLGTQVIGSILRPASFCGAVGYKPSFGAINRGGSYDGLSQSAQGVLAATPSDAWTVLSAIANRVGGDAGFPGLEGPLLPPAAKAPKRLGLIQTAGWDKTTPGARQAMEGARKRLSDLGIAIADRTSDPQIEALEQALAPVQALSLKINAWECIWSLGGVDQSHARTMSPNARDRLAQGLAMTIEDYRGLLRERQQIRERFAATISGFDALITLAASGAAPKGLTFTGETGMIVPGSLLGGPAIALPLLADEGLPLGLQLLGKTNRDADLMAVAQWLWQNYEG